VQADLDILASVDLGHTAREVWIEKGIVRTANSWKFSFDQRAEREDSGIVDLFKKVEIEGR
jgi:hypothetical protein